MSFQPSKRRHGNDIESEPLNLIPIMNLLTILIPFLTLSAVFMKLAILPTTLPAVESAGETKAENQEEKKPEDQKPKLNLTVTITSDGFTIAARGGQLAGPAPGLPTVPKKPDGSYDFETLTKKLVEIKRKYPWEQDVVLVPQMDIFGTGKVQDIPYQLIIDTMDAVREAPEPVVDSDGDGRPDKILFPGVIFSVGVL